ncbi:MG2 domain-containing protein [Prevotella sp. KH2C16]|uniref:alpha-2-macroglobulin family protein n=1 Tax=Prevotella sp. KH2C16 TaxID=1855325 RepID=UPI0008E2824A|nr:MG2 domain-containing protein [Prevotella sp. KH2C16]SFG51696.1 CarboxypepD_reg-like domain-containing protein [Prevotella sp. KH2C16]
MKKLLFTCLLLLLAVSAQGQSYEDLWVQFSSNLEMKPRTAISILRKIESKAEKELSYGNLLRAQIERSNLSAVLSPDSVASFVEVFKQKEASLRTRKPLLASIYAAFLHNQIPNDTLYNRLALANMPLLASAKAADFAPAVELGPDGRYFGNDLLSVIGYYLGDFKALNAYYTQVHNRPAALLTGLEWLRQRRPARFTKRLRRTYLHSLDSLQSLYSDLELAAEIATERYKVMAGDKKISVKQRYEYLTEALNRYSGYSHLEYLKNQKALLTAPSYELRCPQNLLTTQDTVRLRVNYTNLHRLQLVVYKINMPATEYDQLRYEKRSFEALDSMGYLQQMPSHCLSRNYSPSTEYAACQDSLLLPPLLKGVYLIRVSSPDVSNKIREDVLRVSDLRLLSLGVPKGNRFKMVVVSAVTGRPVPSAFVRQGEKVWKCDCKGELLLKDNKKKVWIYTAADAASPFEYLSGGYGYVDSDYEKEARMSLFTDRNLYRPGQTVHVAGIYYDQYHHQLKVKTKKKITLELYDANSQMLAEKEVVTDDFGTCSADFELPKSGLTGTYSIDSDDESVEFQVAEYKRPTFEVSIDKVDCVYQPGDTLRLKGHAKSLMGEPVQRAAVEYTVRFRAPSGSEKDESPSPTSLNTVSDEHGNFTLPIPLTADVEFDDNRYCAYEVEVKTTDMAGESYEQHLEFPLKAKPVELSANFRNGDRVTSDRLKRLSLTPLNNKGIPVKADIVYWYKGIDGEKFLLKAGDKGGLHLPQGIKAGRLKLLAACQGDTLRRTLVVFDPQATRPCYAADEWFYQNLSEFAPQNQVPVTVSIGSSEQDIHAYYAVFAKDKLLESGTMDFSDSICTRKFLYREAYGDGIVVAVGWYRNGRAHTHDFRIEAPLPDKRLIMKWNTFRDRLRPGTSEEWSLHVATPDGRPAVAQLMATLYDQSLDRINEEHAFQFFPNLYNRLPRVEWWYRDSRALFVGASVGFNPIPESSLVLNQLNLGGVLGQVRGVVSDDNGDPLIGCVVRVLGTDRRTATDIDGHYSIKAFAGEVLEFSYIGCLSQRQKVATGILNVQMTYDGNGLDEVVVTGYVVHRKSSMVGSVVRKVRFTAPVIKRDSDERLVDALSGSLPGIYGSRSPEDPRRILGLLSEADSVSSVQPDAAALAAVPVRENLNETAFFVSHLTTDSDGNITLNFTVPESITAWKFLGLAHTRDVRYGLLESEAVSRKDFMVQPNQPRFLRVGDEGTLSARIFNSSDHALSGSALLQLLDAETEQVVYEQRKDFSAPAGEQQVVKFSYAPKPSDPALLICKVVASAGGTSDGEQHYLPVLSNRELVTQTLTFTQQQPEKKTFDLRELFPEKDESNRLTVEYTSNPSWLLLPALAKYAHPFDDCALCQSGAYYVNSLARHILTSSPDIRKAVEAWAKDTTMVSPLQRNENLRNLLLNETPWVAEAKGETRQKEELVNFFKRARIDRELGANLRQLRRLQNADGSWSWFKGMDGSFFVTLATAEALVRLNTVLGQQADTRAMLSSAFGYMGAAAEKEVARMKGHRAQQLSSDWLEYLYLCAMEQPRLKPSVQDANAYLVKLIEGDESLQSMFSRALGAIIFHRAGREAKALDYVESLKQHTVYREDMGRYFDTKRAGYTWRNYKIPTQTAAIEAIRMITPDDSVTIRQMQQWLLQEKRAQYWENPVVTVDAVNAFVAGRGNAFVAGVPPVSISSDGTLQTSAATPQIGYVRATMQPDSATQVTIDKKTTGTSWGTLYLQAVKEVRNVESSGTELQVKREILKDGEVIAVGGQKPVKALKVGDKVTVRIMLDVERDLDFVQIVDKRPACLEPTNQMSGYDYTLRCYCATKDVATHYFFDKLHKGHWTIENTYFVDRAGHYSSGSITAQCAYAPEFSATGSMLEIEVE